MSGSASGAGAAAPGEQLFYGRTSEGRAVSIDLRGGRTAGAPGALVLRDRHFLMLKGDSEVPLPGGTPFTRGAIHFHRVVQSHAIRTEVWFDALSSGGGQVITGTYRGVTSSPGYRTVGGKAIRFRTTQWAASDGAPWAGSTADGRPLAASVFVLPSPEDAPRYAIGVAQLTHPLHCIAADGSSLDTTVTLRDLKAPLVADGSWTPPTHGGYMFTDGLQTSHDQPVHGSADTAEGVSGQAVLTVTRLSWRGTSLVATGTVSFSGKGAGSTCRPVSTGFTLRPAVRAVT